MGARNVKLVYACWADLDDAPFRLLAYMALVAVDGGDQPRFWAGRDALAYAAGRVLPDGGDVDAEAERKAAFKAVTRSLGALRKAGAVTLIDAARPGHNAVYGLNLNARRTPLTGSQKRARKAANGPHSAGRMDPTQRTNGPHSAGRMDPTQRGPEEDLGEVGTEEGGEITASTTSHPPRVETPVARNVIPFTSRARAAGSAELASKGERARAYAAELQARRTARKEPS